MLTLLYSVKRTIGINDRTIAGVIFPGSILTTYVPSAPTTFTLCIVFTGCLGTEALEECTASGWRP